MWNNEQIKYFYKELKESQIYEKRAAEKICVKNHVEIDHFCENYKYDFQTSDGLKYELKHDKASIVTGNFFIEYASNDNPSGITSTQANFYIIVSGDEYYLIKTDDINEMIQEKKYHKMVYTCITNKTNGFLFKKDILIEKSEVL